MFKEFFDKKRLIIFDLDGTVIQSKRAWDMAFMDVAKMMQQDIFTFGASGAGVAERWKAIIEAHAIQNPRPISELVELTQNAFLNHLGDIELTEGFWPFVAELKLIKNMQLALVTNTVRAVTDKVVAHFEIDKVFDLIICGDEVKKPKPDPEIYKRTLAHFKIPAKEALVFEDSLIGCISAAKAGLNIICVWDGETPKMKYPDEVLGYTWDFSPFPGEMDTTYYEDILEMAKEQEQAQAQGKGQGLTAKV